MRNHIAQNAPIIMKTAERNFFDVPVYRVSEEKYYQDMRQHIDKVLFPPEDPFSNTLRELDRTKPNENSFIRSHLAEKYGGCWQFNEIVGYIRLFFLGNQVRGEYYVIGQKSTRRTRHKVFEQKLMKLAPDVDISDVTSNANIFDAVLEYLSLCRNALKRRHIDSTLLEQLGRYVDWQSLIR